jgi:hypothetical protein
MWKRCGVSEKRKEARIRKRKVRVERFWDDFDIELLKLPVLLGLLGFDLGLVLPYFVVSVVNYGFLALLGLVATQSPLIYLVVYDVYRKSRSKPSIDIYETTTVRYEEVLQDYVSSVKSKRDSDYEAAEDES